MTPFEIIAQISNALNALGVDGDTVIIPITPRDETRLIVYIDGERFGIFDTVRNTFVD